MRKTLLFLLFSSPLAAIFLSPILPAQNSESIQTYPKSASLHLVFDYPKLRFNPIYTFTAQETQVYIGLYEGLFRYDEKTMRPKLGIASRWEKSDDGLRYTFTLKSEARFSNGDPIRPEHIRRSWLQLIEQGEEVPFSSFLNPVQNADAFRNGRAAPEKVGIQVTGSNQITVLLERPFPELFDVLSLPSFAAVHPSLLSKRDWSGLKPEELISSGAYQIESQDPAGLFLQRNPHYWDYSNVQSPSIFIEKFQPENQAALIRSINGYEIDWVNNVFSVEGINHPREWLQINPQFSTFFLFFANTQDANHSWSAPPVRQALSYLLPLEEMRDQLGGDPHLILQTLQYQSKSGYTGQDKEKAMTLLEQAGYPRGRGLGDLIIRLGKKEIYEDLGDTIRESWQELETTVLVEFAEPREDSFYIDMDNAVLGTFEWVGDYLDPTAFLNLWHSKYSLDIFRYQNEAYDQFLHQAQNEPDPGKRYKILAQAESLLLREPAVIPIFHRPAINLINPESLEGWYPNPLDLHPLQTLRQRYVLPAGST